MAGWKAVFFSIIAVILVLVLVETAARLLEPRFAPRCDAAPEEVDPVILEPKEPGELRIFAYGGSTVMGDRGGCDPWSERLTSFMNQLRFHLEKRFPGRKITIGNFGRAGEPSSYVCAKMAATIQYEPDVLIVLTGHNEYLTSLHESEREAMKYMVRRRLDKLAASRLIRHGLETRRSGERIPPDLRHIPPLVNHGKALARRVDAFRENIDIITRLAAGENLPLLLCTAPSNIRDWPPLYIPAAISEDHVLSDNVSAFTFTTEDAAFEKGISELRILLADGETGRAETILDELSGDYPDNPLLDFLRGRLYLSEGSPEKAAPFLVKARDADPFPNRASTRLNMYLRAAAARSGVVLVDADSLFARHSGDGLPGLDLVADNCHPSPAGNSLLARELFSRILDLVRAEIIDGDGKRGGAVSSGDPDAYFRHIGFDPEIKGAHYFCSAKYCMKTPFMNYGLARGYLEKAAELLPDSWEVYANLATVDFLENKSGEGVANLRSAIDLLGDFPDLSDRISVPYLEPALAHAGLDPAAF